MFAELLKCMIKILKKTHPGKLQIINLESNPPENWMGNPQFRQRNPRRHFSRDGQVKYVLPQKRYHYIEYRHQLLFANLSLLIPIFWLVLAWKKYFGVLGDHYFAYENILL